jgi:hypothetical protein
VGGPATAVVVFMEALSCDCLSNNGSRADDDYRSLLSGLTIP